MVPVETPEQQIARLRLIDAKIVQVARWYQVAESPTVWDKYHEIIAIHALIREGCHPCKIAYPENDVRRHNWWDPARNKFSLPSFKITNLAWLKPIPTW